MSVLEQTENIRTAADVAKDIRSHIQITWLRILRAHEMGMNLLWDNLPEGVTPQDVIDEFGTDAGEIFQHSAALATLIGNIDPEKVVSVPEQYVVNVNATGTVTLTEAPVEPTE